MWFTSVGIFTFFPANTISFLLRLLYIFELHYCCRLLLLFCSWTSWWAYSTSLFLIFPFYCSHSISLLFLFPLTACSLVPYLCSPHLSFSLKWFHSSLPLVSQREHRWTVQFAYSTSIVVFIRCPPVNKHQPDFHFSPFFSFHFSSCFLSSLQFALLQSSNTAAVGDMHRPFLETYKISHCSS